MEGYLYVLWHPTFTHYGTNVYKLGMTNNPDRRLQGYSPGFLDKVEYKYVSERFCNCHEAEKVLFYLLKPERLKTHREFFQLPLETARRVIQNLERLPAEEIHSLYLRSKNNLLTRHTMLRLRGDSDALLAHSEQWCTKYTQGECVDTFLDKFKYSKA